MIEGIIFDMDGVLVDTTDSVCSNFDSFNFVLGKYGVVLDTNNTQKYLGRSLKDQLQMWKEEFSDKIPHDLDPQEFSYQAFKYQLSFLEPFLKPNIHLLNIIKNAKKKGIRFAVATSSTKKRAEILLEKIGVLPLLDNLTTAEDVQKHKPDPEIFLLAADKIKVDPSKCVVFEDALNGIKAAKSAGMFTFGKLTRHHTEKDLHLADFIFSDFNELDLDRICNIFYEKNSHHQ